MLDAQVKRLTVKQQTFGEEFDMWGSVPRFEGMIDDYTDNIGGEWLLKYEPWDNEVEITDVHFHGKRVIADALSRKWIKEQEDRIACVVFGCQAHS